MKLFCIHMLIEIHFIKNKIEKYAQLNYMSHLQIFVHYLVTDLQTGTSSIF